MGRTGPRHGNDDGPPTQGRIARGKELELLERPYSNCRSG